MCHVRRTNNNLYASTPLILKWSVFLVKLTVFIATTNLSLRNNGFGQCWQQLTVEAVVAQEGDQQ